MAARIPMIATTIISSMSVKPRCPPHVVRLFRQKLLIRPPLLGRAPDCVCKGRAVPGTAGDYAIDARFFRELEVQPPRATGQPCPRWAARLTEQGNKFGHRPARVVSMARRRRHPREGAPRERISGAPVVVELTGGQIDLPDTAHLRATASARRDHSSMFSPADPRALLGTRPAHGSGGSSAG